MSNKSIGSKYEQKIADYLFEHDWWVHRLTQNASGQPADIIAVYKNRAYLIDAKYCENDKFPVSRVEENQHLAMTQWNKRTSFPGMFVLGTSEGDFVLWYSDIADFTGSVMNLEYIKRKGTELEKWVQWIDYCCWEDDRHYYSH